MKKLFLILPLLVIFGCSSNPKVDQKPADPIFIGTKIEVPIPIKCSVVVPPEPAWEVEAVLATATSFDKSKAALAELEQRRDYINKLKAAAKNCE